MVGLTKVYDAPHAFYVFSVPIPYGVGRLLFKLAFPLLALVPVLLAASYWANRRAGMKLIRDRFAGRCLACGYDLHGNVSRICPECGTPAGPPV